jgi:hypothetical protein
MYKKHFYFKCNKVEVLLINKTIKMNKKYQIYIYIVLYISYTYSKNKNVKKLYFL